MSTLAFRNLARLELLHEQYTERVNQAVQEDRYDLVSELSREYEVELARLQAA